MSLARQVCHACHIPMPHVAFSGDLPAEFEDGGRSLGWTAPALGRLLGVSGPAVVIRDDCNVADDELASLVLHEIAHVLPGCGPELQATPRQLREMLRRSQADATIADRTRRRKALADPRFVFARTPPPGPPMLDRSISELASIGADPLSGGHGWPWIRAMAHFSFHLRQLDLTSSVRFMRFGMTEPMGTYWVATHDERCSSRPLDEILTTQPSYELRALVGDTDKSYSDSRYQYERYSR